MSTEPLAIHGGPRAFADAYPWPMPDRNVLKALEEAWQDGSWGRYDGRHTSALAAELGALHGCQYVSLCSSGTIAVELALRGLGVGPGHEVVMAAYDYPGNFRAIESLGATPVLIDIDASWCLAADEFVQSITPSTRAVLVSHLHGGLANMERISRIAAEHGLSVIEDACQAPGAIVQGRIAGSWGHAAVLSFGGSKLLTAGRGGAVLTNDERVHQRIRVYSQRGNEAFPLSEIQAAVLGPQLSQLPDRNELRRSLAVQLVGLLVDLPQLSPVPVSPRNDAPSLYKLAWRLHESARCSRDDLVTALRAEGVPIDAGFRGFTRRGLRRCRHVGPLGLSRLAASQTLLLHHPVLLSDGPTMVRLAAAIRKVVAALA